MSHAKIHGKAPEQKTRGATGRPDSPNAPANHHAHGLAGVVLTQESVTVRCTVRPEITNLHRRRQRTRITFIRPAQSGFECGPWFGAGNADLADTASMLRTGLVPLAGEVGDRLMRTTARTPRSGGVTPVCAPGRPLQWINEGGAHPLAAIGLTLRS